MGPHAWDELVVPYDGPLINLMHRYGAIVHYHNHGNMRGWLERIAALDVDSLDPIEQPPYGNVQMAEAMAAIGERVCLVGGLDDMEVLETEPPEVVRATAEALLQSMDATTGFMLGGTSSGIYGEAAARRFIELVDVAEAFA
jgi:uroporphyrinogen-III decarboxylase